MRTKERVSVTRFCLFAAAAVAVQILWLSPLAGPSVMLFNFLAYASLTLLLWIAAHGRRPLAVPVGVILLGACVSDAALAAAAAVLTAATLFFLQEKPTPIARL
jgi:hypothetical protein